MGSLLALPELRALDDPDQVVRIPDQQDVPLTARVGRLVDTAAFRRLASVSQLGLVSLVYPGAKHSRFEHSLGAYRLGLLFLRKLATQADFAAAVDERVASSFVAAALLHDIGHWPCCHPVEDLGLPTIPAHEELARGWLEQEDIRTCLAKDWGLEPDDILRLLLKQPRDRAERICCSMLSGPVDIDKMDYLFRDSLHCGVPYGRNFDAARLIGSLCLDESGERLAITDKGRTAAELMVFARYVMFSEVYWHHAVRSATVMFQRAVWLLRDRIDVGALTGSTGTDAMALRELASLDSPAGRLLDGLFGARRRLFKRWWQADGVTRESLTDHLRGRGPDWHEALAVALAGQWSKRLGVPVEAGEILIDAPPAQAETQFQIDVRAARGRPSQPLHAVSPIVQALAMQQFDGMVKKVRLFVEPALLERLRAGKMELAMDDVLRESVAQANATN